MFVTRSHDQRGFTWIVPTFPSLLLFTYYQFLILFPSCSRLVPPLPALSLTKQPWHSLTRNGRSDVLPCLASWYFLNDKRHAPADLQEEIDIIEARETFLTNKVCPWKCFPLHYHEANGKCIFRLGYPMPDLYIFMGSRWQNLIETYPGIHLSQMVD